LLSDAPASLLCGYIKHRKERETKVLKAIESGATTLYEVVSKAYTDVLPVMWVGAASNVRLHVEHLAYQQKLPARFFHGHIPYELWPMFSFEVALGNNAKYSSDKFLPQLCSKTISCTYYWFDLLYLYLL
jgi:hypothetical protein